MAVVSVRRRDPDNRANFQQLSGQVKSAGSGYAELTFTFTAEAGWEYFLHVQNNINTGTAVTYYADDIRVYYTGTVTETLCTDNNSYRYGFNNQEKDNELYGTEGTAYAFEYRIHDTRLGRFLSVDPLAGKFPFWSSYQFAANTPIMAKDLEGLEPDIPENEWSQSTSFVKYNYYGDGGTLMMVQGWWVHLSVNQEGRLQHLYYNYAKEEWVKFYPMGPGCTSCGLKRILSLEGIYLLVRENGHEALDGAGMLPVYGEWADGINALWYYSEGDITNGSLSLAGVIPFAGWAATGTKFGLKFLGRNIDKVDEFYQAVSKL